MKKLLSILAALGLTATSGAAVVACGSGSRSPANGGNSGHNDNDGGWYINDNSWSLNFNKENGDIKVDEKGYASATFTFLIQKSIEDTDLVLKNGLEVCTITGDGSWNFKETLIQPGDKTYTASVANRETADISNGLDKISIIYKFYIGAKNDFSISCKYRIKILDGSVNDLVNGEGKNYKAVFFNSNQANVRILADDVFVVDEKAWWDNDTDRDKAFAVKDLKCEKNENNEVTISFSFDANEKMKNSYTIGKMDSWVDGEFSVINESMYKGGIAKENNVYKASFTFDNGSWKKLSLNSDNWMTNQLAIVTKEDSPQDSHLVKKISVDSSTASQIKKDTNYFEIKGTNKPFGPGVKEAKLLFNYGPFIDIDEYKFGKETLKVLSDGLDVSSFFSTTGYPDETGIGFDLIGNPKNTNINKFSDRWNDFINYISVTNSKIKSHSLDIQLTLEAGNSKLVSNSIHVSLDDSLFINSVENKDNKKIVQVDGHYTTGIYLKKSLIVKTDDIDELGDHISLSGSNKCVVEGIRTIDAYDDGYSLVEIYVYPYGISSFGTTATAWLMYEEGDRFTDPEARYFSICQLNLGEFWPAGFADSSLTVEGYDEAKGITIDSKTKKAEVGKLKYGNNVNISDIKITLNNYGQIKPLDSKETGINAIVENDTLLIELDSNYSGKCIRPYDFNKDDDEMVNDYGTYKLQINIAVGLYLNDQGSNSKNINIDKINYSPDKDDVISVDNYKSENLEFDYDGYVSNLSSVETEIDVLRTGDNVDWDQFNSSQKHFKAIDAKWGSSNGDASEAIQYINNNMDVSFDKDKNKIIFKLNPDKTAQAVNEFSYLMKNGSCIVLSLDLKTKDGRKVIFNQTNTFTIYFRAK